MASRRGTELDCRKAQSVCPFSSSSLNSLLNCKALTTLSHVVRLLLWSPRPP